MVIVKGEREHAELAAYLLDALDSEAPQTAATLRRAVLARLRSELGVLAPQWRPIEVFGALTRLRLAGLASPVGSGWIAGGAS